MKTSFGNHPRIAVIALTTLALILGCASGDDDDEDTWEPLPRVEPTVADPEPRFQRVRLGETAAAEWAVSWPGGDKPRHIAFDITTSNYPPLDSEHSERAGWNSDRTRFRIEQEFFQRGPHTIQVRPTTMANTTSLPVDAAFALVQVMGGPADVVAPPLPEVDLAIGEVRPMSAFPATALEEYAANPNDSFGERFWSDEPLAFSIDDPSIATVDDKGVVTGKSAGVTELRVQAGAAEASITLNVADIPLGPPSDGMFTLTLHGAETYRSGTQQGGGPMETKVAVDENGWPSIVIQLRPGASSSWDRRWISQLPPMALLSWTGTGFGLEYLGEPGDRLDHGLIDISADGRVNLLLHDTLMRTLEVWSRPTSVQTGEWEVTEVPMGPEVSDALVGASWWEASWREGAVYGVSSPLTAASTLPSDDGGTWFAWSTKSTFRNNNAADPSREQCPRMIRLAKVTDGRVDVELVEQEWLLNVWTQSGCNEVAGGIGELLLMPPSFGGTRPTLIGLQGRETLTDDGDWRSLYRWRHAGETWIREVVEEDPDGEQTIVPRALVPVLPIVDGQDWYAESDWQPAVTWAWQDLGTDTRYTNGIPALDRVSGDGYAGHAVSDEKVFWFENTSYGEGREELVLFTGTLPSLLDD